MEKNPTMETKPTKTFETAKMALRMTVHLFSPGEQSPCVEEEMVVIVPTSILCSLGAAGAQMGQLVGGACMEIFHGFGITLSTGFRAAFIENGPVNEAPPIECPPRRNR